MGQGLQLYRGGYSAALHGIGFHKFHAGRGVEEQIPDDDGGTVRATGFGFFGDISCFQRKAGAGNASGGLGQQINTADRCDGSQSFTTETHGSDGSQVFRGAELGCGMPQESSPGIFRAHAAAVIGDADKGHAAVTDFHRNLGGACIYRIFQQFLYHGGRPFHYLTGGY